MFIFNLIHPKPAQWGLTKNLSTIFPCLPNPSNKSVPISSHSQGSNYFDSSVVTKFETFIILVDTPAFSNISSRSTTEVIPKLFNAFIAAAYAYAIL